MFVILLLIIVSSLHFRSIICWVLDIWRTLSLVLRLGTDHHMNGVYIYIHTKGSRTQCFLQMQYFLQMRRQH